MVPQLFRGGLTQSLIQTLHVICKSIEEARGVIQSRLFDEVNGILRNYTNQDLDMVSPAGSPASRLRAPTAAGSRTHSQSLFQRPQDIASAFTSAFTTGGSTSTSMDIFDENSYLVVMALETLRTFDFYTKHQQGAHQVLKTVRESVINCLDDDDKNIRRSATITCCR